MLNPQVCAQCLFQLLVKGAAVGEDFVVPDLLEVGGELFQRGQIRLCDVDGLVHGWLCSAIGDIPGHGLRNAFFDGVRWAVGKKPLRFADVGLAVTDIPRTEVAVVGLCGCEGLPYFALNV